jgi:hypothetical protein
MTSAGICGRCNRTTTRIQATFPDGAICSECYRRCMRDLGVCDRCAAVGPLPGRSTTEQLCASCAGIDGFTCDHCNSTSKPMVSKNICRPCRTWHTVTAALELDEPLDDTTTRLVDVLCDRSPDCIGEWLGDNAAIVDAFKRAIVEQRPLDHGDLDRLPRPLVVKNVRNQLIAAELLPPHHHGLALFDAWSASFLADFDHDEDRRVMQTYIRWSQRRRLEESIETGVIRAGSFRVSRRFIRAGTRFLQSLRDEGRNLETCTQGHIDHWFADGNSNTWSAINFLAWARRQRLIDHRIVLPVYKPPSANGMSTDDRIEVVRHLLTTDELSTGDRFAGLLVSVYAQQVTKVSRMRRDAIDATRTPMTAALGSRRIEIADEIANIGRHHLAATEHDPSIWLFPGQTSGQPISSHGLGERLRVHGVTKQARISALHDLTRKIPSIILADLIGYNRFVVANRANVLGSPWQLYATLAGQHTTGP